VSLENVSFHIAVSDVVPPSGVPPAKYPAVPLLAVPDKLVEVAPMVAAIVERLSPEKVNFSMLEYLGVPLLGDPPVTYPAVPEFAAPAEAARVADNVALMTLTLSPGKVIFDMLETELALPPPTTYPAVPLLAIPAPPDLSESSLLETVDLLSLEKVSLSIVVTPTPSVVLPPAKYAATEG
jgi:hypothetical protein